MKEETPVSSAVLTVLINFIRTSIISRIIVIIIIIIILGIMNPGKALHWGPAGAPAIIWVESRTSVGPCLLS